MSRDELLEIIEKHVRAKSPVEYDGLTVEDFSVNTNDGLLVQVFFSSKGEEI
jgi:hypothetical protein